eukprot:359768-Chlamydomonas_euryale.AAC.7
MRTDAAARHAGTKGPTGWSLPMSAASGSVCDQALSAQRVKCLHVWFPTACSQGESLHRDCGPCPAFHYNWTAGTRQYACW